MNSRKKILLCAVVLPGFLLIFMAALILLTPFYLNSPAVKNRIQKAISEHLGGSVAYERLDISLFPRPHVAFEQTSLSIPKTAEGSFTSIIIYPQIAPLVKGKLLFSEIVVRKPHLTISLPETETGIKPGALSLGEAKTAAMTVLSYLEKIGPGLVVGMEGGRFVLHRQNRLFLGLKNVAVSFNAPPGEMKISLKADTERWGAFSLRGKLSINEDASSVRDLSIAMGRSSLSGFSARLAWKNVPYHFEILSGRAALALDEIYQWLSEAEVLPPLFRELKSLGGTVAVASMQAGGPLSRPGAWKIRISGDADNVVADWDRLPAPAFASGRFTFEKNKLTVADLSARMGRSAFLHVSGDLSGRRKPYIRIRSGKATIDLSEIFQWRTHYETMNKKLKVLNSLKGVVMLSSMQLRGPLLYPPEWRVRLEGEFDQVILASTRLPGPLLASHGSFTAAQDALTFSDVQASILDTTVKGSGSIAGDSEGLQRLDIALNGSAGQGSLQWVFTNFHLPSEFMTNAPLTFSDSHLVWQKTSGLTFAGRVTVANGPVFTIDLSRNPGELVIRHAAIEDRDTNATVAARRSGAATDLSFSGRLALATLNRTFRNRTFGQGRIRGDLHASILTDRPLTSTVQGSLEGDNILIPAGISAPIIVNNFSLQAEKNVLSVRSAAVTWANDHYSVSGTVTASQSGFVFDGDLIADNISVRAIQDALKKRPGGGPRLLPFPPVFGTLRVTSSSLSFGRFVFAPAHAVVSLKHDEVSMVFSEAGTCGLSIPGTLVITHREVRFDFRPGAAKQPLGSTIDCLAGKDVHMTGTFDLNADIRAQGASGALLRSLEGSIDFKSKDGKIYRYPMLAKIFSVLSVLEIFRGKLPELGGNGFPYHTMAIKGTLHKGTLSLDKAYIGGSSIDLIAQGTVDIAEKKIDLVVLVAPFSTINWIIRHIPLVGKIMGGTLISVPVKVSGNLDDPDVTFLAPSAVGTRILDILENILELPIDIISPVLPHKKEDSK